MDFREHFHQRVRGSNFAVRVLCAFPRFCGLCLGQGQKGIGRKASESACRFQASLDGPNHRSPIASVQRPRSTLASHSAVPRGTNATRMNANRTIRISKAYEDKFLCLRGTHDRQRTLVIRIAAITLTSDSAITIAQFRPSKYASRPWRNWLTKAEIAEHRSGPP